MGSSAVLVWIAGREAAVSHQGEAAIAAVIDQLFRRHSAEIYAYVVRMLRDPELAEDVTQETFVRAFRAYDTLERTEHARAWLYQIALHLVLDEIRRRKILRFVPWSGESRAAAPSVEHEVMELRLSAPLARALARIPERQRAALILAEVHDLSGLELAAALGISHAAARALLTRARESLRQALADEEAAEGAGEPSFRRPLPAEGRLGEGQ